MRVRRASDQKYSKLNSIARIHVWKDIHAKNVCQIACLIWTWKCKHVFQASWVIFLEWKKSWPWCFFCRKKQVLQWKCANSTCANSTVARFSQYPTQSIQRKAIDGAWALEGYPHTQVTYNNAQTELLSESQKGSIRPKIYNWIPLPVFMFERTFMQKMFVKLCAWFGPENTKPCFKHLELFFLEWKKPWPSLLQHQRGFGAVVVGVFFPGKSRFFNVRLQIAPGQGFHNIQSIQCKEKQQMGLRR